MNEEDYDLLTVSTESLWDSLKWSIIFIFIFFYVIIESTYIQYRENLLPESFFQDGQDMQMPLLMVFMNVIFLLGVMRNRARFDKEFRTDFPDVQLDKSPPIYMFHMVLVSALSLIPFIWIHVPIDPSLDSVFLIIISILIYYISIIILRHHIVAIYQFFAYYCLFATIILPYLWVTYIFDQAYLDSAYKFLWPFFFFTMFFILGLSFGGNKFYKVFSYESDKYFNSSDSSIIYNMCNHRDWKSLYPEMDIDEVQDILDRFDDFVEFGKGFQSHPLIWFNVKLKADKSKLKEFVSETNSLGMKIRRFHNALILSNGFVVFALWPILIRLNMKPIAANPSKETIVEVEELIFRAKRRSDILIKNREILGFRYRNTGHPMYFSESGESKLFSSRKDFYQDKKDLQDIVERDERLSNTGLIYRRNSLTHELILKAGIWKEYEQRCLVLQLKISGSIKKDEQLSSNNISEELIFPQFSPIIHDEPMKQPIVQWLEENKISRNDNLTNKFLDCIRFAELHLHIGGILSIESQIKVGEKIWSLISEDERKEALKLTKSIIDEIKLSNSEKSALKPNWNQLLREQKKLPRIRAACAASILVSFRADPLQLCYALFPSWDHRWENRLMMAGKRFGGCEGYAGYSTPGELMGSTMLCFDSDDVIKQYAWGIVREAEMQNLSYLEIRMSPTKYRPEILSQKEFVKDFVRYMNEVISIKNYDLDYRILISADRSFFNLPDEDMDYFFDDFRQLLTLLNSDTITRAVVAGYDIAGRENDDDIPGNIMKNFIDLNLDLGLSTTFHAGEQADSSNLRSAYSIHTNRVGHALRLIEHPRLLDAFVKSQICVEMCPTSNIEVHGYLTPDTEYYNFKGVYPEYPLRNYFEAGLPITICTDNTFISRTNMKNEIITASELLFDKPLTFFECMKIVYNGYKYSFTDFDIKKQLISKNGILMYDNISKIYEESVSENNAGIESMEISDFILTNKRIDK